MTWVISRPIARNCGWCLKKISRICPSGDYLSCIYDPMTFYIKTPWFTPTKKNKKKTRVFSEWSTCWVQIYFIYSAVSSLCPWKINPNVIGTIWRSFSLAFQIIIVIVATHGHRSVLLTFDKMLSKRISNLILRTEWSPKSKNCKLPFYFFNYTWTCIY